MDRSCWGGIYATLTDGDWRSFAAGWEFCVTMPAWTTMTADGWVVLRRHLCRPYRLQLMIIRRWLGVLCSRAKMQVAQSIKWSKDFPPPSLSLEGKMPDPGGDAYQINV